MRPSVEEVRTVLTRHLSSASSFWESDISDDASCCTDGEYDLNDTLEESYDCPDDAQALWETLSFDSYFDGAYGQKPAATSRQHLSAMASHTLLPTMPSLPFRLAAALMAIFFSYAAYVRLNDPDWHVWLCLYGGAFLASLPQAGALLPHTSRSFAQLLLAVAGALLGESLYARLQEEGLSFLWTPGLALDVATEAGREQAGLALIVVWMAVLVGPGWVGGPKGAGRRGHGDQVLGAFLLAFAGLVLASIWIVPMYFMDAIQIMEMGHCHGLGFAPDAVSDFWKL